VWLRDHRLTVGQRVFGVTDWCRNGTLAEFVAVEARTLRRCLPEAATYGCGAAISGLTAWQGLFTARTLSGPARPCWFHGAAGGVGSVAVQLLVRRGPE